MIEQLPPLKTPLVFRDIQLSIKEIPFKTPLKTATKTFKIRRVILLYCIPVFCKYPIVSECSFLEGLDPNVDTIESCYFQLKKLITLLKNTVFQTPFESYQFLEKHSSSGFCRSAFDYAYWALYAKKQRQSLASIIGQKTKKVPYRHTISLQNNPNQATHAYIKQKTNPNTLKKWLDFLKKQSQKERFYLDANGSLDIEHIPFLITLKDHIAGIEQPFHQNNTKAYDLCHKQQTCPIFFDESIKNPQHAKYLINTYPKFGLSIKPCVFGGITPSLNIAFGEPNTTIRLSGCFETDIGRSYLYALSTQKKFSQPCDGGLSSIYLKTKKTSTKSSFYYPCPSLLTS